LEWILSCWENRLAASRCVWYRPRVCSKRPWCFRRCLAATAWCFSCLWKLFFSVGLFSAWGRTVWECEGPVLCRESRKTGTVLAGPLKLEFGQNKHFSFLDFYQGLFGAFLC
jgi:hypothetical protein